MPLPLVPLILGGLAASAAGYGIKKGLDAKEDFARAKRIGEDAEERHEEAVKSIDRDRKKTNGCFVELGKLKAHIFTTHIDRLVKEVKKRKNTKSSLKNFEQMIEALNLPQMEKMVTASLDLETGLASGATSGALAGLGAYGSVGMLASASTGTAIASLSGAAATNATLAWLGGGSLAAGGLGMAGGTAVLGGIVAGPAIAVVGMVMASRAEEAVTKAREYEANVDEDIEKIKAMKQVLKGLRLNATEMEKNLVRLSAFFEQATQALTDKDDQTFHNFYEIGKTLKTILDTPIMLEDGSPVPDLKTKINLVIRNTGLLESQ